VLQTWVRIQAWGWAFLGSFLLRPDAFTQLYAGLPRLLAKAGRTFVGPSLQRIALDKHLAPSARIRVFVVVPEWPLVVEKGYQARAGAFIRHLSGRHEVTVVPSKATGRSTGPRVLVMSRRLVSVLQAICRGWPLQVGLFEDRFSRDVLLSTAERFGPDVCLVVTERLPLTTVALARRYPVVVDVVDALELSFLERARASPLAARTILMHESRGFRKIARLLVKVAALIVVSADREQQAYPSAVPIYNGAEPLAGARPAPRFDIAFTGNLAYWPNVDAVRELCEQIVPRVRAVLPTVRVLVAGRRATKTVRDMCARASVDLAEDVDNLSDLLIAARLAVAPLPYATGLQLKVVEALAVGTPVIAYPAAAAGLPFALEGVSVCSDAASMAEKIVDYLRSSPDTPPVLARSLTWAEQARRLESVLHDVASGQLPTSGGRSSLTPTDGSFPD
jgi:glycosyltransferase involved in cell wall biosynthesis